MAFQKFSADFIFDGKQLLDKSAVLIMNENGVVEDIINAKDAGDDVKVFGGILSPGFINCHCHIELSHLKNVIDTKTGLVDFLLKVISNRGAVSEDIQSAMQQANDEMFNAGIVAVGDICNTTGSINLKKQSRLYYQNFIEVLGFTENAEARFQSNINTYNSFCEEGFAENTSIVPHAPYTVSKEIFGLINDFSTGKIISIHNQESLAEDELYHTKTGAFLKLYKHLNMNIDFFKPYHNSSLKTYLPLLGKAANIILVHNTFTTQSDIDFSISQNKKINQQLFWCLCPNANLYIENTLPPVELFIKNNCIIVLGTDSYSSNFSLNILDEMKTLLQHFPAIKTESILAWATINGAKALNKNDIFGSFEKGKKPGIVLIDQIQNRCITQNSTAKRIA